MSRSVGSVLEGHILLSPFQHKDVGFKCPDWQEVEKKHFKMKCNIGMKRGTRSKMMCKIRAHFPSIWEMIH